MYLDAGASATTVTAVSAASTPCNVALCGTVLAISPDGNRVVVSDGNSVPHQVYIFDASSMSTAPVDLILPSGTATAAAFSPDEMKVFILAAAKDQNGLFTNTLHVYSTVDALQPVVLSTGVNFATADAAFSSDGSFAYVAGTQTPGTVSGYSVCTTPQNVAYNVLNFTSPKVSAPLRISPLPGLQFDHLGRVAQSVLALDPPNIDIFTVGFAQNPPLEQPPNSGIFFCQPPTVGLDDTDSPPTSFNLGQGNFIPLYMRVVGNGSQVIVVGKNIPAVLVVDVNQQTTTPIALVNNGLPRAASSSTDGSQVFVAACDAFTNNDPTQPCTSGSVHIINTLSGGDFQQVPYVNINTNNSMCNQPNAPPCFPNLIAIKPQ
jgi:DNA-binding beta-propeller fold protein YncE